MEHTTNPVNAFIMECEKMIIAQEENMNLKPALMQNKKLNKKYNESVKQLRSDIKNNTDNCLNHAMKKHKNKKVADAYVKSHPETTIISYFKDDVNLQKKTHDAVQRSTNDIKNNIYDHDEISITQTFDENVGFVKDLTTGKVEATPVVRMGIINEGTHENPKLKIKSIYPLPIDKRRYTGDRED